MKLNINLKKLAITGCGEEGDITSIAGTTSADVYVDGTLVMSTADVVSQSPITSIVGGNSNYLFNYLGYSGDAIRMRIDQPYDTYEDVINLGMSAEVRVVLTNSQFTHIYDKTFTVYFYDLDLDVIFLDPDITTNRYVNAYRKPYTNFVHLLAADNSDETHNYYFVEDSDDADENGALVLVGDGQVVASVDGYFYCVNGTCVGNVKELNVINWLPTHTLAVQSGCQGDCLSITVDNTATVAIDFSNSLLQANGEDVYTACIMKLVFSLYESDGTLIETSTRWLVSSALDNDKLEYSFIPATNGKYLIKACLTAYGYYGEIYELGDEDTQELNIDTLYRAVGNNADNSGTIIFDNNGNAADETDVADGDVFITIDNITVAGIETFIEYKEIKTCCASQVWVACNYFEIDRKEDCGEYIVYNYSGVTIGYSIQKYDADLKDFVDFASTVQISAGSSSDLVFSTDGIYKIKIEQISRNANPLTTKYVIVPSFCAIEACQLEKIKELTCEDECTPCNSYARKCEEWGKVHYDYIAFGTLVRVFNALLANTFGYDIAYDVITTEMVTQITTLSDITEQLSKYCDDCDTDCGCS